MKLFTVIGIVTLIALSSILPFPREAAALTGTIESTADLTPYQPGWVDEFNSSTLDERWTWVREKPSLWSLTANPGMMQITSEGSLFQTANNQRNILLTPAPDGDYRITTRVQVTPTENYHGAALYVYQDDDNFIELTRIYSDGPAVVLRYEIMGVYGGFYAGVTQNDILLRIVKEGNVYSGWFSEDNGATWNFIDQLSADFGDPKVGLGVRMGLTSLPLTANFDWIKLESVVYNTGWHESFDTPDLDERWNWVRENPSLWSLTAYPGRLQIISEGSIHLESPNDQANILLTEAPAGDYRLSSGVVVLPTVHIHGATLLVYQDDDNYIELGRVYSDYHGQSVAFKMEEAGIVNTYYVEDITGDLIRLRIEKEGDTYTGWFSYDNVIWHYIWQHTLALSDPQVGISAKMGVTTMPVTAEWLYVRTDSYIEQVFLPVLVSSP